MQFRVGVVSAADELLGNERKEFLVVGSVGVRDGLAEVAHQGPDDVEARKLDLHHRRVTVDVAYRSGAALLQGLFLEVGQMRDETLLETAFHDGIVVGDEDVADATDELVDEHGAQEGHALVGIAHLAVGQFFMPVKVLVVVAVEEADEAVFDVVCADDATFVGIFHVEDEVTDIVGST